MNKLKISNLSVGYITVIMVFAVICLTILAVLSFQTASSGNALTERNAEFNAQYYAADTKAKQTLMRLDNAAVTAAESGFFEDTFPSIAAEIEGVTVSPAMGGATVKFGTELNGRLTLSVSVKFFASPRENGSRYEITEWKTVSAADTDSGLDIWDGNF